MSYLRKARGSRGEAIAATFLSNRGFSVRARNWSCPVGEIDLIVERDGEVRFVEVKYRCTREFGYPEASITGKKLRHLERAILAWLDRFDPDLERYQADAIAITEEPGKPLEIYWIEAIYR